MGETSIIYIFESLFTHLKFFDKIDLKEWLREKSFRKGTDILKITRCVNFKIQLLFQTVYM